MMKTVFKTIQFETKPKHMRGLFQMRNTERNLRGSRKLVIPYVNTTTHGLHSFRYTTATDMEQTNRGPEVTNVRE